MCGIAGFIGKIEIDQTTINSVSKALHHRGPDANGVFKESNHGNNILLIHQRLSIIDLNSHSNQPFIFNNLIIIFNGEIYNYIELKNELISKGYNFVTSSDTEVLIKSFDCWKFDAFNKFEGMWSLVIYNKETGEVIISRDRFGEKPLYYIENSNGLYFASEVKVLKQLCDKSYEINHKHINRYLINGYKSLFKHKETFFKNIFEFPKGCYSQVNNSLKIFPKKYWSLEVEQDLSMSREDAVQLTREKLISATKLCLRSDVPLAFCMSGGVDSNCLISIAKNILDYDVNAFSIMNNNIDYDEKDLITHSSELQNINHFPIDISNKNFIENLTSMINLQCGPVATISYYLHFELMKKISEKGYKISISGVGADELFTGYYDHYNLFFSQIRNDKKLLNKSIQEWKKFQLPIIRNSILRNENLYIDNPFKRDHIYHEEDNSNFFLQTNWGDEFTEQNYHSDLLRNRMLNELFTEVVPVILHQDDLNAMNFSIENRTPFLNFDLFKHAYSIPTKYLIKNAYAKSILREAMDGIVPSKILNERKKIGFNAPIEDLIDFTSDQFREQIYSFKNIYDIINKKELILLLDKKKYNNFESKFLFNFLNSAIFLDQ